MRNWAKTVLFYVFLGLVGVVLFIFAHEYATRERGYIAYGGEVFFIALPLFAWLIKSCVRDARGIFSGERKGDGEEWQKNNTRK